MSLTDVMSRIPQVGPVFFKFLDFVFRHISFNLREDEVDCMALDLFDLVGFVIDTSAVDQNKGFVVNQQSFLCLFNQMMATNSQLTCHCINYCLVIRHFQFEFCLIKSVAVL